MEGRSFIHFVGFVHILKQTFILKEGSDSTDSGIGITHSKNFAVGRSGIRCTGADLHPPGASQVQYRFCATDTGP